MKEMSVAELQRRLEEIRVTPSRELEESIRRMADAAEIAGTTATAAPAADHGPARLLRNRIFRLAAGLVLACGAALALWRVAARNWETMPSAYAQVAEAVANSKAANWIHVHGTVPGEAVEMWACRNPFRQLKKEGNGQLQVLDVSAHRQYDYSPVTHLITVSQINEKFPPEFMGGKMTFLDMFEAQIKSGQEKGMIQVTRGQRTMDGRTYAVLKMTPKTASVKGGFAPSEEMVVDPLEKRVVQVEIFATDGGKSIGMLQFDYPAVGPEDIYALGAPKDAKVVNAPPPTPTPVADLAAEDVQEKVSAARDRFAPTYCAAVFQGILRADGSLQPEEVDVTYKKNGRWRVERYIAVATGAHGEPVPMDVPADDMERIMAWVKARRPWQTSFLSTLDEGDVAHWGVTFSIGKEGKLDQMRGSGFAQLAPEYLSWHPFLTGGDFSLVPSRQGAFGPLVSVERKIQGRITEKGFIYVPQRTRWSVNPSRDHIVEEYEIISNPDEAPWQVDKDWRKGVKLDSQQENRWSESRQVLEYAQTAQGQWYAKRILQNQTNTKRIWIVYLDTAREIPDELLDPAKVDPAQLDDGMAEHRHP